jgi:hypothetical protein
MARIITSEREGKQKMQKIVLPLLAMGALASAGEANIGIISCEPQLIYKCTVEKCEKIPVVNVDGSQHFEVDAARKRLIGKIGENEVDINNIASSLGDSDAFVYFGLKKDTADHWVMRIAKKSGKMAFASINGTGDSYTIFGTCSWEEKK